jgi:hypothetical protein
MGYPVLGTGAVGVVNADEGLNPFDPTNDNRFADNIYFLPAAGAPAFIWNNTAVNAAAWMNFGQDVHGTFVSP